MYSLLNLNTMARTGSIPIPFFFFYRRSYFNWLRPSNAVIIRICIVRTSAVFSGTIGYCPPFISLEIPSHKQMYSTSVVNNRHGISTSVLSIIPYRNLFTPCFSIIRRTFDYKIYISAISITSSFSSFSKS